MKTQNNIPKLRFPEFSDGWEVKKLQDLLEFKNGINATKEQYGKGYKFINVLDILNNDFITHDKIIGSVDVSEDIFNKYPVNYGDILFQRSSETREEVGTASVYLDKEKTATFGGFVIRGKKIGEYEPFFLSRLLQTDLSRNQITSKSGGSTRYNVGQEILMSIEIFFPTLPEQKKIATFLSTTDEKLQALKKKKSLLESYKKGVMQKLFSQNIRFKDDEGNDFEDWEITRMGEVTTYVDYRGKAPIKTEEGRFLVTAKNIKKGFIDYECSKEYVGENDYANVMSKGLPAIGDILFTTEAPMGNVAQVDNSDIALAQRVIKFRAKKVLSNLYLLHYMLSDIFQKAISDKAIGTTVQGISGKELHQIKISFPPLSEQIKIANFLTAIDAKINKVETQIKQTEHWKKGLLQQMFV